MAKPKEIPLVELAVDDLNYDDPTQDSIVMGEARPVGGNAIKKAKAETTEPDAMEELVQQYTRFAQLVARGSAQPNDYIAIQGYCRQVVASAEALVREAEKRRNIAEQILRSVQALKQPADASELILLEPKLNVDERPAPNKEA